MQQEAHIDTAPHVKSESNIQQTAAKHEPQYLIAGISFVIGAIIATVFNVLFPRADDPSDTAAVLTMMTENEMLRQVSFLGVTAGLWAVTAGLVGIYHSLKRGKAAVWVRLGFYGALAGAALFTVSTGLGLVATGAASNWVAAGSDATSAEFAIASALNSADDGVWFMSIILYWGALSLIGVGMLLSDIFPKWLGTVILVLSSANALLVGVPLAVGVVNQALIMIFAGLGQLTLVWALAMGSWMLRKTPTGKFSDPL